DIINIPKSDTVEDLLRFVNLLEKCERGVRQHANDELAIKILANIETPLALQNAAAIAASHKRVWGLQLGLGDLFEPLGIARDDTQNVHTVMMAMRLAAGTAGKIAYDTAYTHVANTEGYREEAWRARQLGYLGKTCIHPSQVALANSVFNPTADEVIWAKKVVASAQENKVNGAYMLEGTMIDETFIKR